MKGWDGFFATLWLHQPYTICCGLREHLNNKTVEKTHLVLRLSFQPFLSGARQKKQINAFSGPCFQTRI